MKLHALISLEGDEEVFSSLLVSALQAKQIFPDLEIDIFSNNQPANYLVKMIPKWINVFCNLSDLKGTYSLIIQLLSDQETACKIENIRADAYSGILTRPQLHVKGLWAQTYVSSIGSTRFSPFTLTELFKKILVGEENTKIHSETIPLNKNGKIIVDIRESDTGTTKLIQEIYTAYPGRVEELTSNTKIDDTYIYIGSNPAIASLVCQFSGISILLHSDFWDFKKMPASKSNWNIPKGFKLNFNQFNQMIRLKEDRIDSAFRLTDEYLGTHFIPFSDTVIEDNLLLFDYVYYVAYNYINSLIDIDLPIPKVTSLLALKNKGIISVLNKISHLNKFGMKFINDYFDESNQNINSTTELKTKILEIDDLTERTLGVYPELDFLRLQIRLTKAKVPGIDVNDIARNLMLTFHEINQIIQCVENLLVLIVNQHMSIGTTTSR